MAKRSGLGKGLDALFLDNNTEDGAVTTLKLTEIEPNKNQPRQDFAEEPLRELADSIRNHGVIQPLVVRPLDSGGYQIVAGERRWRASRMAGLNEVPVVIRQLADYQTLEIAIIENLQREDLNVIELALGYQTLIEQHGLTQEKVAEKLGKSRPVVANTIRLLGLPKSVQEELKAGKISRGHAKALLALEDAELIETIAKKIISENLLVRDIEKLARKLREEKLAPKAPPQPSQTAPPPPSPTTPPPPLSHPPQENHRTQNADGWTSGGEVYHREMEIALGTELGRKIKITSRGRNGGTIEFDFYNDEELTDIAERLSRTNRRYY